MNSVLRPNYRRARALALEIEALKERLYELHWVDTEEVEDLKAELLYFEREFSLTGVTSEYDL
jgi:hypothetical protein